MSWIDDVLDREYVMRTETVPSHVVPCVLLQPVIARGEKSCPHAHDELDQCRSKCSVCDSGYGPSCPECRAVV